MPDPKPISFKTKVVETLTPDQISLIKDLEQLHLIEKESEEIMLKVRDSSLNCVAQSNDFQFAPIAVLDWVLKNGYTVKPT